MRKPHSKCVLKTLPPDRQCEVYDYLKSHSQRETIAWLATGGIKTGPKQLTTFWHWYPLAAPLYAAAHMGDGVKEILRELPELDLDEHQLSKVGQSIFEVQALQAQDTKLFMGLRRMRQTERTQQLREEANRQRADQMATQARHKERDLELAERRVKVMEQKASRALETVQDTKLSAEEQARRIRQIFGEE